MIKFLDRKEIDETKWNAFVAKHPSGLPYAYSWYLDAVASKWNAFVLNDYEAIMPHPVAKKYGISYVYQPPMCQQLGVFALEKDGMIFEEFYAKLNRRYLVYHICQNAFFTSKMQLLHRTNFELNLNRSLQEILERYNTNTKRNIAKAEKQKLQFSEKISIEEYLKFAEKHSNFPVSQIEKLARVLNECSLLFLCVVHDEQNEINAANLCIKTANRIIHLVPVTAKNGRKNGAMHFLLHNIIRAFSEQDFVLDFEGSMIEGIAQFYRSFGAEEMFFYEKKRFVR
ncbi:MAG TPA: hypothetical protein VGB95_02805 [Chitinophagales bacterium]